MIPPVFEFFLLCAVSIFAIINPFSTVPAFLAITPDDTREDRIRMARTGCVIGAVLLLVIALLGQWLFRLLGITIPAVQIGGGLVLLLIGIEMLRAPETQTRLNKEEREIARERDDVAITPLAIPLLCGPGAISTVIILQTRTDQWADWVALLVAIPVVYFSCYLILRLSVTGARWLNPIVLRVLRRIMGLLFVVIAAQFFINGIAELPFFNPSISD